MALVGRSRFKYRPCPSFLDVPGQLTSPRDSDSLLVSPGCLGSMAFKMEDSGLLGPRNSGLIKALGGRSSPRQECGRRAHPQPQEREGPWVGKKLFGTSSRGLVRAPEPPSPRPPEKTLAVVLAAVLVQEGCVCGGERRPPTRGLCQMGFCLFEN